MKSNNSIIIYNLFPTLRPIECWKEIASEAARMGFNYLYINPICSTGKSGSLYAIDDFFKYSSSIFPGMTEQEIEAFFTDFFSHCKSVGILPILDIVLNHVADSSPLIQQHPSWFEFDENGNAKYAYYYDGAGNTCYYGDIVRINHNEENMTETLPYFYDFCVKFLKLGCCGFRTDMPLYIYEIFMSSLISKVKSAYPGTFFLGESINPVEKDNYKKLKREGFDCAYNLSFCWDCSSDPERLIRDLNMMSNIIPTIGIAESHDTDRLINICGNNLDKFRQRLWMNASLSSGFMMTAGAEFANSTRIDVFTTSKWDWEENVSFKEEIRIMLSLKTRHKPLSNECEIEVISNTSGYILIKKSYEDETIYILINRSGLPELANNLFVLKPHELILITKNGIFSSYPANNNTLLEIGEQQQVYS